MRWMTMDPLAEKYYHISPYAYCVGDPVNLADPDGRNPFGIGYRILSGAIGAGADFGVQIGTKMLNGDDFNGAFKKVDWTSVGGSFVTCLISPKKTLGKVAIGVTLAVDASVDISIEKVEYVGGTNEHKKSVGEAALDFGVGVSGVGGGVVGEEVANAVEKGFKNEARKYSNSNPHKARQATGTRACRNSRQAVG
jgi:hypothetical protein